MNASNTTSNNLQVQVNDNYSDNIKEILSKEESYHNNQRDSDILEFREFCLAQERVRLSPGNVSIQIEHCAPSNDPDEFKEEDLIQIFSLFMIFLLGVIVRVLLQRTRWKIPYTVVLMVLGLIVGISAKYFCPLLYNYTALARTKPEIILLTFLPILIFESAFSISVHTFLRSANQILIVALPGMLISTFLTALISLYLLRDYGWSFVDASLFGSIISATDPVAVVAILRDLGASETLSVLIEGESLLNDGVAVLLFEIFKEILEENSSEHYKLKDQLKSEEVEPSTEHQEAFPMILNIFLKFLQIAIGGPIFGYIMAKLSILGLSKVYNDSVVEISITLASTYLTYFIGEEVLGVSGIMAVVILGITLSSEKTCISPESEKAVHHFWEMLGYLANTVLFVLIGVIIGERALINVDWMDGLYLIALYLILNIIRAIMLIILSPLLARIGYGLEWKNVMIMSWGGLRGAVGLCLALEIYENPHFCERKELGPKILFLTAGIVFLTLVINATSTKKLMELLRLTKVSESRMLDVENAWRILEIKRARAIAAFKQNRFVCDAEWSLVEEMTKVDNPYGKNEDDKVVENLEGKMNKARILVAKIISGVPMIRQKCPVCETRKKANMTLLEYQELAEEARLRVLKALKTSFWSQYQQGLMKGTAVKILISLCEKMEDSPFKMIGSRDLGQYWEPSIFFQSLLASSSASIIAEIDPSGDVKSALEANKTKTFLPSLSNEEEEGVKSWKIPFVWLGKKQWFTLLMDILTSLSILVSIFGILIEIAPELQEECLFLKPILISLHAFISLVLGTEVGIKVIAFGIQDYFEYRSWHYVDIFVLTLSLGDVLLSAYPCLHSISIPLIILKCFGLLKILRLFRILCGCFSGIEEGSSRLIIPKRIKEMINRRGVERICLGYEIGKGFVTGIEHVFKLIPLMPDDVKNLQRLKGALEREKMEVIRELGKLQRKYPDVAMGAKTRHASRAVLNAMRQTMNEMKNDGIVDEAESEELSKVLEKKMKKLSKSPASLAPSSPDSILENINWFKDDDKLLEIVKGKVILLTFVPGDMLYSLGERPKGIYIIVSGLVKIQYLPSAKIITERNKFGVIPNSELLENLKFTEKSCDILSSGMVIGEVGFLKHQERAASVTCETFVTVYYLTKEILIELSRMMEDESSSKKPSSQKFHTILWKSWGFKVATSLFHYLPQYDDWSLEKIQGYLERAIVPKIEEMMVIEIPDTVSDVVIIEGYFQNFQNFDSMEIYIAPCLIPSHCTRLQSMKNPLTKNRLLIIPHEDVDLENIELLLSKIDPYLETTKFTEAFGKVDNKFSRIATLPIKGSGERLGIRQRRLSIAINTARLVDQTSDEEKSEKKQS